MFYMRQSVFYREVSFIWVSLYLYNIAVLVHRTLTVYKHVDTSCIYMSVYLIDRYFGGLSAHGSNWSSVHLYIP